MKCRIILEYENNSDEDGYECVKKIGYRKMIFIF